MFWLAQVSSVQHLMLGVSFAWHGLRGAQAAASGFSVFSHLG